MLGVLLLVQDLAEVGREFIPPTCVSGADLLNALLYQIVTRVSLQKEIVSEVLRQLTV